MENNEIVKVEQQIPEVSNNSFLDKESFAQMCKVARMFSESSLVPSNYQGKPQDCIIAVDMANRMGVSPMMVMQNLYVVKGKPSWSGQACMSLIQNCGRYKNVHPVYTGTRGTDDRGCYIEATSINDNTVMQGTEITISMAKSEGWMSNPKWKNMPEQMLAYRAAAFFARVYCPDALMGMQLADEIIDIDSANKTDREVPNIFNKENANATN